MLSDWSDFENTQCVNVTKKCSGNKTKQNKKWYSNNSMLIRNRVCANAWFYLFLAREHHTNLFAYVAFVSITYQDRLTTLMFPTVSESYYSSTLLRLASFVYFWLCILVHNIFKSTYEWRFDVFCVHFHLIIWFVSVIFSSELNQGYKTKASPVWGRPNDDTKLQTQLINFERNNTNKNISIISITRYGSIIGN